MVNSGKYFHLIPHDYIKEINYVPQSIPELHIQPHTLNVMVLKVVLNTIDNTNANTNFLTLIVNKNKTLKDHGNG